MRARELSRPGAWALALFVLAVLPCALIYALWPKALLFLPDDAYYYFEVAQNLALGYGSTFDRINPTNGYHPLWCLLLVVLACARPGKDGLVMAALLVQCAMVVAGWWLAFRSLHRTPDLRASLAAGLTAVALGWNFYISKMLINGLEAALLFLAAAWLIHTFSKWLTDERGLTAARGAQLGLLATFAILSRLDSFYYVPAVLLVLLASDRARQRRPWGAMLCLAAVPAVALAAYMGVNQTLFGIWLPVSGYVKRALRPTGATAESVLAFILFAILLLGASWLALGRRLPSLHHRRDIAISVVTLYLLMYQAEAYLIRGVLFPEIWYLGQHVLWAFLVGSSCIERLLRWQPARARRAALGGAALAALAAAVATWAVRLERSSYDLYVAAYDVAHWINETLPDDAILAGWDVGIVGYYAEPRLINLDGLMNSWHYVQSLERGAGLEFLDACGVQYITQYRSGDRSSFEPAGYEPNELRRRTQIVVHARHARFAPWSSALETGRRTVQDYQFEVREYLQSDLRPRSNSPLASVAAAEPASTDHAAPSKPRRGTNHAQAASVTTLTNAR